MCPHLPEVGIRRCDSLHQCIAPGTREALVFDLCVDLTPLEGLDAELADVRGCIGRTEALIDQIVYRLYGLSEEEIAIVETSGR